MNIQLPLDRWNDPQYIQELGKNRRVIGNFSRLTNTHSDTILGALSLRQETGQLIRVGGEDGIDREVIFDGGYNMWQKPKGNNEYRTISEPAPVLHRVQEDIKDYLLAQIETYSGAVGGERGKSFVDNARLHSSNSRGYLVNMDLANAYPSVSAKRLFVNLRSALRKKLDITFPGLGEPEKDEMIDLLVILMTNNNEIPQGASTSMKALNIVMAKSDQRIIQFLNSPELHLLNMRYSRFVDDLSISWREFGDMYEVWRLRTHVLKILTSITEDTNHKDPESISTYLEEISNTLDTYESIEFSFNTREQRRYLVQLFQSLHTTLDSFTEIIIKNSNLELLDKLDTLKAKIRNYRYDIEQNKVVKDGVQVIQRGVRKILINEGWEVKDSKTRMWTPASSNQKVITGVAVTKHRELGIPKEKEKEIREFLERAINFPDTLPVSCRGNHKKIAQIINGYKNFRV